MKHESQTPDALGVLAGEVGDVLDGGAEAGRADQRAVAAGQAALGDLVPARVLEVAREQVAQVADLELAAHQRRRRGRPPRRRPRDRRRSPSRCGSVGEHLGAALGPDLDEEAVLAVEDLGQREVEARLGLRAGAHRDAEARPAGLDAVDGDDEHVLAPGGVVALDVAALEEDAVLDRRSRAGRTSARRRTRSAARRPARRLDLDRVAVAATRCQSRTRGGKRNCFQDCGPTA